MGTAAILLRSARRAAGLNQSQLARRASTSQPRISALEHGVNAPTVDSLDRLLRSIGSRLLVVPTVRSGAAEAAAVISDSLESGDTSTAFRALIQLSDNLVAETGTNRLALALTVPEPTGQVAWDAAIAGITEYRLKQAQLPSPDWVDGPRADVPTVISGSRRTSSVDPADVPVELRDRNVLIESATLESV